MKKLPLFSMGCGDRFGRQGAAQLAAFEGFIQKTGRVVVPVWNKSAREHALTGTEPAAVRAEADAAVKALGWKHAFFVDADHIGLKTADRFIPSSDFFTLDVADFIGKPAPADAAEAFIRRHPELLGRHEIEDLDAPVTFTASALRACLGSFLLAVTEAGKLYRHIREAKGGDDFSVEISMDETGTPQTPDSLLVILAAIADEGIPLQTIAPKFTGRFNKGVNYAGDPACFEREFGADICILRHAVRRYGLPATLKLSVHSGSDKFGIYPAIARTLRKHQAGLHLKTAGTTWLEEVAGLAEAGGEGLLLVKDIYEAAVPRCSELCAPYSTVLDIRRERLPGIAAFRSWTSEQVVRALTHDESDRQYNPDLRQFLHVSFKVAADFGRRYLDALAAVREVVARRVTRNLLERHLLPLFTP